MGSYTIIWTTQAKHDLKDIYEYWKKKSTQGAKNVRSSILKSPKTIYYAKQYQVDDINPKYRRIVVRTNYKVLGFPRRQKPLPFAKASEARRRGMSRAQALEISII